MISAHTKPPSAQRTLSEIVTKLHEEIPNYNVQLLHRVRELVGELHAAGVDANTPYSDALLQSFSDLLVQYRDKISSNFDAIIDTTEAGIKECFSLVEGTDMRESILIVHLLSYIKWHNFAVAHEKGWRSYNDHKYVRWAVMFPDVAWFRKNSM